MQELRRLPFAVVSFVLMVLLPVGFMTSCAAPAPTEAQTRTARVDERDGQPDAPFVIVLGASQDAGTPQAGSFDHPGWEDPSRQRMASCIGVVDPRTNTSWLFDATPDFRRQLYELDRASSGAPLSGIFLTHAHIGHYTGLMFVGHESMGAHDLPVYAMPRMKSFLETNGPWDQLVRFENIAIQSLTADVPVSIADGLTVTPFLVPHRQEYSEVVGYRIDGPNRSILFIPDIDSWDDWDAWGVRIEDVLAEVDVAYVDGTFFANGEIPGRDMSGFPHPFITHTMQRLAGLAPSERAKIRFIHLNHTNAAQDPASDATRQIHDAGMRVAQELEMISL